MYQHTLRNFITASGIGLHTGKKILLTLRPAPVGTGIVFRRTDLGPGAMTPAHPKSVVDTNMSTTLGNGGRVKVATVEHLMSATFGLGVDNMYVDVDSEEVPVMDGSANTFIFLLRSAGIVRQNAAKRFIRIKKEIEVSDGDRWVRVSPHNGFRFAFEIDFDHPVIRQHSSKIDLELSTTVFIKEISRSRTFGFSKDYERLRSCGLARGGSLANAIVLDEHHILNEGGLRHEGEFVRHKVLDLIGDVSLLPNTPIGMFEGHKSGHALNNELLCKLLERVDAWEHVAPEEYARLQKGEGAFFERGALQY